MLDNGIRLADEVSRELALEVGRAPARNAPSDAWGLTTGPNIASEDTDPDRWDPEAVWANRRANVGRIIDRTLDSVVSQEYPAVERMVQDGCTVGTVRATRGFERRSQPNLDRSVIKPEFSDLGAISADGAAAAGCPEFWGADSEAVWDLG